MAQGDREEADVVIGKLLSAAVFLWQQLLDLWTSEVFDTLAEALEVVA